MVAARFDVCGVGNAIVDMIASESDAFLMQQAIVKGGMTLIDGARADALTKALPHAQQSSGGSGANSMAGIGGLGGKAAYIGKTADDFLGHAFRNDIQKIGVEYRTPPHKDGPGTARCVIVVTPDAQRSMSTFLGCSPLIEKADLDRDLIQSSSITFLEGYLFDRDEAKIAFVQAAEYAKAAGRQVALTLSDTFCVDRHRDAFKHLVDHHIDILFSNEAELKSLYQAADFDDALQAVKGRAPVVCVTRSNKGSVILDGDKAISIQAAPIAHVADTTGAGDLYAAGVLFGIARDLPLDVAGRLGSLAASEAISHFGARPQTNLADLAKANGLL